jgi:hypothetical protein
MKNTKLILLLTAVLFMGMFFCKPSYALRDPFEPVDFNPEFLPIEKPVDSSKETSNMKRNFKVRLAGIIWDPIEPYAIMHIADKKKILKAGTVFNNKTVLQITKTQVKLKSNSKAFILNVGQYLTL